MKYSERLEWFYELESDGHKVPALEEEPELLPEVEYYWRAFSRLSSSRSSGFSIGYIAFSEIVLYLNEYCIESLEDRQDYIKWIQFIDNTYISLLNKKEKSKESKKPNAKPAKSPRTKKRR